MLVGYHNCSVSVFDITPKEIILTFNSSFPISLKENHQITISVRKNCGSGLMEHRSYGDNACSPSIPLLTTAVEKVKVAKVSREN